MSCGCSIDQDLFLAVGTSPIWTFAVIDPDDAGAAVDITNATFEFFVKTAATDDDDEAIFTLTTAGNEIVILSASGGTGEILNDATKSELLDIGRIYYYSLRMTLPTAEVRRIASGSLTATAA